MKSHFLLLIFSLFTMLTYGQSWETNFDEALAKSAAEDKPLILVFAGSDWCAPCIKLDKEIWQSETFKNYAKSHYVLYKADFPRKKKNQLATQLSEKNKKLAANYNARGYFPLIVVLDKNAKMLGEFGYKKITPKAYVELIDAVLK